MCRKRGQIWGPGPSPALLHTVAGQLPLSWDKASCALRGSVCLARPRQVGKDRGRLTPLSQAIGVLPVVLRDGACLLGAAALRAFPASGTRWIALGRAEGISEDRVLLLPHKDSVTKSNTWIRLTSPTLRPWISE